MVDFDSTAPTKADTLADVAGSISERLSRASRICDSIMGLDQDMERGKDDGGGRTLSVNLSNAAAGVDALISQLTEIHTRIGTI